METLLIMPALGFCMYMLALTIVNMSMGVYLFGPLVLILGCLLCRATNWMTKEDEENEDAAD
jgi:hypothetical protein